MNPLKPFLALKVLAFFPSILLADNSCEFPNLPVELFNNTKTEKALPPSHQDVELVWPINGTPELNSPFGPRTLGSQGSRYDWHRGADIRLDMGTPILAPADAVVVHAGPHPSYSDTIVQLRHNSTPPYVYTFYLHLLDVDVTAGDTVVLGEQIAQSGQGSATYPHLHWEVRNSCLSQVCCQNPYSFLIESNTAPPAPDLEAFGSTDSLGDMVLLSVKLPNSEIDFQSMELEWNSETFTADLNELNQLTPSGGASKLDDPLYFFEEENRSIIFFPKRFNRTYPTADYEVLFFNLDDAASTGTATSGDGGGLTANTNVNPILAPVSLDSLNESQIVQPGSLVNSQFQITNHDTVSHQLDISGISAQSLSLTLSHESTMINPSESIIVEVESTLNAGWSTGIGDVILLRVNVDNGAYTDILGSSFIDTSSSAGMNTEWKIF